MAKRRRGGTGKRKGASTSKKARPSAPEASAAAAEGVAPPAVEAAGPAAAVPAAEESAAGPGPSEGGTQQKQQPQPYDSDEYGPASESDVEEEQQGGGREPKEAAGMAAEGAAGLPAGAIEEGHVYFFYRPKVQQEHPTSVDDVARFYMVLHPERRRAAVEPAQLQQEGQQEQQQQQPASCAAAGAAMPCRLIIIGKKRMPDVRRHERFYGFVDAVAGSVEELTRGMREQQYETKTRGARTRPAARAAGKGAYTIMQRAQGHSRPHTELAYCLELPLEPGPVQEGLSITASARYVLSIKNPDNKRPGLPCAGPEPQYDERQRAEFGGKGKRGGGGAGGSGSGYSWIGTDDPTLLDVVGTELLLVGARQQAPGETGEAAGQHLEQLAQHDMQQAEAAAAAEAKPGAGAEAAGGAGKGNESVPATAAAGSASGGVVEAALVHQLVEELQASPEGGKAAAAAGGGAGGGKAEEGGGEGQLSVSVAPAATGEWA